MGKAFHGSPKAHTPPKNKNKSAIVHVFGRSPKYPPPHKKCRALEVPCHAWNNPFQETKTEPAHYKTDACYRNIQKWKVLHASCGYTYVTVPRLVPFTNTEHQANVPRTYLDTGMPRHRLPIGAWISQEPPSFPPSWSHSHTAFSCCQMTPYVPLERHLMPLRSAL